MPSFFSVTPFTCMRYKYINLSHSSPTTPLPSSLTCNLTLA